MLCASVCVCVDYFVGFKMLPDAKCAAENSSAMKGRWTEPQPRGLEWFLALLPGEITVVSNCSDSILLLSDHFYQLCLLVIQSSSAFYGQQPGH